MAETGPMPGSTPTSGADEHADEASRAELIGLRLRAKPWARLGEQIHRWRAPTWTSPQHVPQLGRQDS